MQIYTLKDFEKFETVDGFIICPSGDYTKIKKFPDNCSFGEWCTFGRLCSFGESCSFGELCSFGESCSFGEWCTFGRLCSFGESCSFGEWCTFGRLCSFGESCSFGKGCIVSNKQITHNHVISISGCGNQKRTLYLWHTVDGFYAQDGCCFYPEDDFKKRVLDKYGPDAYCLKAWEVLKLQIEGR